MSDEDVVRCALPDVILESHPYRDEWSACSPEMTDLIKSMKIVTRVLGERIQ